MRSLLAWLCCVAPAAGETVYFAGFAAGVSTLSADAGSAVSGGAAALSQYKPENGPALNVFGGAHLSDYISVQGSYVWNANDLSLASVDSRGGFYEQRRSSSQRSLAADLLLYFRNPRSRVRPFLSGGVGVAGFRSSARALSAARQVPPLPPDEFMSAKAALRVAVGMDVAVAGGWAFRYSFCEILRSNPISALLTPPGSRNLANFQNLFGFVKSF